MDHIYRCGHQAWIHVGNMGRNDWLLVALCVVVFGYYCTKID